MRLADQPHAGTEALGQEDQRQIQPAAATEAARNPAIPSYADRNDPQPGQVFYLVKRF
jgi:hypothetical protein